MALISWWYNRLKIGVALAAASTFLSCGSDADPPAVPVEPEEAPVVAVTLLHTTDLHHRATGYGAQQAYTPLDSTDQDQTRGGYARLAALIAEIRAAQAQQEVPVLLVDSGDFLMGTLFDLTFDDPLAFRFFQAAGYDAVTLGNHEFDAGLDALATLLDRAGQATPPFEVPIVASNLVFSDTNPADDRLAAHQEGGTLRQNLVLELANGLRVGLLGLLGPSAEEAAVALEPAACRHSSKFLSAQVAELKENQGADLVVALAHAGLGEELTGGEAEELAEKVEGLDVIAAGHTHFATQEPYWVDDTLIVQPGDYGRWLGRLDLLVDRTQGRLVEATYHLVPVDDTVGGDEQVHRLVQEGAAAVDRALAESTGLASTTPVAELAFPLPRLDGEESAVVNLVADGQRYAASLALQASDDPQPVEVALQFARITRDALHADAQGVITFSDLYNLLPLGLVPPTEEAPRVGLGWPVVSFYLNAGELRNLCQITTLYTRSYGPGVYLNVAGIRCDYDLASGTVSQVRRCGPALQEDGPGDIFSESCDTTLDLLDTESLLRVSTDLYGFLRLQEMGILLQVFPKQADGNPLVIENADRTHPAVIRQPDPEGGDHPLLLWEALLLYLRSFDHQAGDPTLPDIPAEGYGPQGRAQGRFLPLQP